MTTRRELLALIVNDFLVLNLGWVVWYVVRMQSTLFDVHVTDISSSHLLATSLVIYGFWMIMFAFFGLYRSWYVRAPFDEIITILKTVSMGTLVLAVILWWDTDNSAQVRNDPRITALTYWAIVCTLMVSSRSLIRYVQRRLLESGIGARASLIVGDVQKSQDLALKMAHFPRLGYQVLGFVTPLSSQDEEDKFLISPKKGHGPDLVIPKLGTTEDLEVVIDRHEIREVLIALGSDEHEALIDVIARASKSNAGLKIVPDLYDIISGQARAREIYGVPLIDINPVLLRPWEEAAKRSLDMITSGFVILLGSPVWLMTALAVKLTSKGPVIYFQERIGRDGLPFHIYKFRSMYTDAERGGPQWASKNDPRVTPLGRFLRRSHLDEVPQFWNVLKGDMSLVGPRPERDFFVKKLVQEIPYYNRRHKVRPGITGLYQAMVDKYDENIDDVKQRVRYDLMYIESMSFRLDVKILFRTAYMMLKGRGQA